MDSKILDVVSTVSVEKDVDKNIIFEALEEALSSATKKLVGEDSLIAVKINQSTGEYKTFRLWEITDEEDLDSSFQIGKGDLDGYVVEEGFAKKIIENIFSLDKNKTLILVTHRHETVKQCDEILLFSDGRLIDQGDYNYLNKKYNLNVYIEEKY